MYASLLLEKLSLGVILSLEVPAKMLSKSKIKSSAALAMTTMVSNDLESIIKANLANPSTMLFGKKAMSPIGELLEEVALVVAAAAVDVEVTAVDEVASEVVVTVAVEVASVVEVTSEVEVASEVEVTSGVEVASEVEVASDVEVTSEVEVAASVEETDDELDTVNSVVELAEVKVSDEVDTVVLL